MSKFKVGDKVKILNRNGSRLKAGSVHHVSRIDSYGSVVIEEDLERWYFWDSLLELIEGKEVQKRYKIEGERKVVVIGDSKYYEDELQTALANINPIQ